MYIRLTLVKSLIVEAIKNETYQRGKLDKSPAATGTPGSAQAISQAYHETAGDETYHERMIERSIVSNLADFKTRISDYLTQTGQTVGDNITQTTDGDNIILTLSVSDRFNTSHTDDLAKLASEYIVNASLMDWYRPIDEKRSALYASFLDRNITAAHRCFTKVAPQVPSPAYTSVLNIDGSAIDIEPGEETTITYALSDGAIDDIEARVANKCICTIGRSDDGFTIKGRRRGHTLVEIFSRHNDELTRTIHVFVTDHS